MKKGFSALTALPSDRVIMHQLNLQTSESATTQELLAKNVSSALLPHIAVRDHD